MTIRKLSKNEFKKLEVIYEEYLETEKNIQIAYQVLKDVGIVQLKKMTEEEIVVLIKRMGEEIDAALLLSFCIILDEEKKKGH